MDQQPPPPASSLNFTRQGAGKPLLLLHGLGGNLASWGGIAIDLAETNEVIAVDLPGHGASPVVPGSGTFAGVADGVAEFIHAQDLQGVAVVDLSHGGRGGPGDGAARPCRRHGRAGSGRFLERARSDAT